MNRGANTIRNILVAAGIIEIAVGLLHFAMPSYAYQSSGFGNLQPHELDFVTLSLFAVGILLVAFGILTAYLAFRIESATEVVQFYLVIKVILFSGRVFLEYLYPVSIGLFSIEPFTIIVMPGLIIELLLFVSALALTRKYVASKAL